MITFLLYMILIPIALLTIPFWITVIGVIAMVTVALVLICFLVIAGLSWGSCWPVIIGTIVLCLVYKEIQNIRAKKITNL